MDDVEELADDLMNSRKQFAVAAPRSVFPFRNLQFTYGTEPERSEDSRREPTDADDGGRVGRTGRKEAFI